MYRHKMAKRAVVLFAYPLIILILTWPWALHFNESYLGYQNVDAIDTLALRGLIADWLINQQTSLFWPTGYPFWELTPNILDHLLALPLITLFPFPLSDNLWWLLILSANGWAGHHLGETISKNAGFACGITWMMCEAILREANLHHAPQSMLFCAPLFVASLIRLNTKSTLQEAILAGVLLGVLGLCYWYSALFLVIGTLPWLFKLGSKHLLVIGATTFGLCLPGLLPFLVNSPSILSVPSPDEINSGIEWASRMNNTPLFFLKPSPADVSNRIAIVAIVAAAWGWKKSIHRRKWLYMVLIGSLMLQGTYWTIGTIEIGLPFAWFGELHPFIDRLHWPQRWGYIVALAVACIACRAPKPWIWLPLIFMETLFISKNAPIDISLIRSKLCLRDLSEAEGALIEFPIDNRHSNFPGLHRRFHGKALYNPMNLPPRHRPQQDWLNQHELHAFVHDLERGNPIENLSHKINQYEIGAIYVPTAPPLAHQNKTISDQIESLRLNLGPEISLDCAAVWWFSTTPKPQKKDRLIPQKDPVPKRKETVIESPSL